MEKKSNTVKKKKKKRLDAKENFWGYVFLSPIIIGFLVFTVFPVVMSFYYSLTNYDGIQPPKFVGFQNSRCFLQTKNSVRHCFIPSISLLERFPLECF